MFKLSGSRRSPSTSFSPECIGNQYPYEVITFNASIINADVRAQMIEIHFLVSLREDSSSHLCRRCIHAPNCIDIVSAYDDRDKHRAFSKMMMIHSKSFVHFSIERERNELQMTVNCVDHKSLNTREEAKWFGMDSGNGTSIHRDFPSFLHIVCSDSIA